MVRPVLEAVLADRDERVGERNDGERLQLTEGSLELRHGLASFVAVRSALGREQLVDAVDVGESERVLPPRLRDELGVSERVHRVRVERLRLPELPDVHVEVVVDEHLPPEVGARGC